MLTVATANVNGIRAAVRRGIDDWIARREPDVLLLQEVRAPDELVRAHFADHHVAHLPSRIKGRAGVAVVSRLPLAAVRDGVGSGEDEPDVDSGRWLEADLELPGGDRLTVVSAYLHSGSAKPGQEHTLAAKYDHLDQVSRRLDALVAEEHPVLVAGDVNIAHREVDIANWKGNLKSSGFLPAERAYLDRWFEAGWRDLGRALGGDGPGPYTWWTWRGQAFDNDRGWRIDYQLANPVLADRALKVEVDRAASYDARWSDHAPVVATYDLPDHRGKMNV
ncbi:MULTISPECIES: exodeoxyribonuclease III [unclassified Isoptericola]|uniref:exodeoxyribonuclease III n=1 Tax=unclassified Isoptericola TaxID=2623355 RepID=UPI002712A621|nr:MULTISPECIES: exodeoxyribonuclease III [unclassified Isoptericola]MDO8143054.1 exodeoxyribonuclease III [Isoptericola sp. 178]MDO8146915.1 exodeoxyribonuclease III [Isoptericola sp. b515]MDO8150770.1 exodeoxyribonuclease III [Isoptericola sp. b408]